jgi:hypothetical protein
MPVYNYSGSTRLRVLDHYRRSGYAYTEQELTDFVNRALELRGESAITSRTTFMDDLLNIKNEYYINILRKKHGRQTTYQYEDYNFSIFFQELSDEDFQYLDQTVSILQPLRECRSSTG